MNSETSFPDLQCAVARERALREVRHAPIAGFLILLAWLLVSLWVRDWAWALGLGAAAAAWGLTGPLARLLPERNRLGHALSLVAYPLNIAMLALIAFCATRGIVWDLPEPWASLDGSAQWLALAPALAYGVLQFLPWRDRIRHAGKIRQALSESVSEPLAEAVQALMRGGPSKPGDGSEPTEVEFRTVPASPKNLRRYLRLDARRHGVWRVVLLPQGAIVCFRDGSRAEAVPRGSFKIVAEDPSPGASTIQCLVRWNQHLHEGRIAPEDFYRLQAWNRGEQG
ncbi:MAG TPA: hypothetical protein PKL14_00320 [Holophaga sp.]|nr:hypothetical protein [Holophaga sp.]